MSQIQEPGFHIVTMGCAKNRVDSEGMTRVLVERGLQQVENPYDAEVVIVNTCGFLAASRAESVGMIGDLLGSKRDDQFIIAAGCMPALPNHRQEIPAEVDAVLTTHEWDTIGDIVGELLALPPKQVAGCQGMLTSFRRTDAGPSAYLKISDGCDHNCNFCTIPLIKGGQVSKRPSEIIWEIDELVSGGTREVVLVAQDTIRYGADLGIKHGLPKLLQMIVEEVPELPWLRMLYIYPSMLTLRMVDTMAGHDALLPYLDMPIQHADKDVLRSMGRPSNVDMTRRLVDHARTKLPEVAMRTTLIVGHPGETERQFETLVDFVEEMQFDHVGVFTYSHEPGTVSATLENPVPQHIAEERRDIIMEIQQGISLRKNQQFIGRELEVLIEGTGEMDDGLGNSEPISVGRARRHAPEVDGMVFIPGELPVGELIDVEIQEASPYDLWATMPDAALDRARLRQAERDALRRSRPNHSIRPDQAGRLGDRKRRRGPVLTLTPSKRAGT